MCLGSGCIDNLGLQVISSLSVPQLIGAGYALQCGKRWIAQQHSGRLMTESKL